MLVVGDVIGHDSQAAAAMGQVRGLVRGIAHATGAGPAQLLRAVDEAVEGLELATSATAVVARLDAAPAPQQDPQPVARRLVWSNAGHPPPLLRNPDGSVDVLEATDTDLLLGVDTTTARREQAALLAPGSTLLLCTDGLVERRGTSLDEGLDRLRAALAEVGGAPLEAVCDALLVQLLRRSPTTTSPCWRCASSTAVRETGLEPARREAQGPKPCVAASYTTRAGRRPPGAGSVSRCRAPCAGAPRVRWP